MSAVDAARNTWARARVAGLRLRHVDLRSALATVGESSAALDAPLSVNCVVFSKDRAMQLDACLRSIARLAPYDGPIFVLYRATSPAFAESYRLLARETHERVRLVAERDSFKRDVLSLIDAETKYTVFHTDDDVFFRSPPNIPVLPPGFAAFSLRLGENTTRCYTINRAQDIPTFARNGPFIGWRWPAARDDFSYPMSLDGHIFHTGLLLRLLGHARFTNPNQLEDELYRRRYRAPSAMLAFRESCVLSLPVNVVSSTHRNRSGDEAALSAQALNARFLDDERIDLDAMDFSEVRGAHQEVPLAFRKRTS